MTKMSLSSYYTHNQLHKFYKIMANTLALQKDVSQLMQRIEKILE